MYNGCEATTARYKSETVPGNRDAKRQRRSITKEQLRVMSVPSLSRPRVVIAEPFAEHGLAVLRESGIDVASCVGKGREALIAALKDADGLIVRSETRVDRALLAAGPRLAVVARAGVGVDAIDVAAATDAGIVVLNTPGANTLAATEQTFALMLSLLRHAPAASQSLREGRWDRSPFIGTELYGKTLGIIGLGRIGASVAVRAKAFGMKLIAYDPFISQTRADAFDTKLVTLEELLASSNIVTLHVPLTPQTDSLMNAATLAQMRPDAYLINCARGGVVDEAALLDALDGKIIAAAGIDVVRIEPPPPEGTGAKLHRHPRVIATPHLGGSTHEALARIAIELAHDVVSVLLGGPASGAVNAPVPEGPEAERLRPFVDLAYRMGVMFPQVDPATAHGKFSMVLQGEIAELGSAPLVSAFLSGLLQTTTDRRVSVVNADAIARELGIRIDVRGEARKDAFAASLRISGGATSVAGSIVHDGPRIIDISGFEIDAVPAGAVLMTRHKDMPGMIGKVGTILGNAAVNISAMQVSRNYIGGDAIMMLSVDKPTGAGTIAELRNIAGIHAVLSLQFPK